MKSVKLFIVKNYIRCSRKVVHINNQFISDKKSKINFTTSNQFFSDIQISSKNWMNGKKFVIFFHEKMLIFIFLLFKNTFYFIQSFNPRHFTIFICCSSCPRGRLTRVKASRYIITSSQLHTQCITYRQIHRGFILQHMIPKDTHEKNLPKTLSAI